ncbi:DUF6191 domain-containing protein [Streptomyces wuyuanensis]|uniref:Uncharacterized protein n=1 Tax=Streptomyces wuyuanensis TaxID=1196353 RepID=A0A1G9YR66_9ACTN|nr:DUF6191 domain-containing protein [Streptomyces wuyuanensis]SDN10973.1 hypothetical protein SAMN05444921_11959 [Streptomyces wuyuanensis]
MGFAVFLITPGLVILLAVMAFADRLLLRAGRAGLLPWRNSVRQGQISATGFEQLHATFSPGKQSELKERQSALLLRDDEEDGAPPNRTTIDPDGGTAVVRVPADRRGEPDGSPAGE